MNNKNYTSTQSENISQLWPNGLLDIVVDYLAVSYYDMQQAETSNENKAILSSGKESKEVIKC